MSTSNGLRNIQSIPTPYFWVSRRRTMPIVRAPSVQSVALSGLIYRVQGVPAAASRSAALSVGLSEIRYIPVIMPAAGADAGAQSVGLSAIAYPLTAIGADAPAESSAQSVGLSALGYSIPFVPRPEGLASVALSALTLTYIPAPPPAGRVPVSRSDAGQASVGLSSITYEPA